jgi:hypothetical protein
MEVASGLVLLVGGGILVAVIVAVLIWVAMSGPRNRDRD